MKQRVLYIEDEPFLGKIVRETLESQGFDVLWKTDGHDLLTAAKVFNPDICVLDIMLPDVDGYQLCRQLRNRFPALPVIFLTAKTETADLVKGFEAGGTDYMRKPFSIEELMVRIRNQIRLMDGMAPVAMGRADQIRLGSFQFLPTRSELKSPQRCIKLSLRDAQVLAFLCEHINQVADRREMLVTIWGDDSFFNSRTLDVYIRKIRNYFSEEPGIELVTMKGKGYLFLVS
jgi:DNA-binding response OmpR family regulator